MSAARMPGRAAGVVLLAGFGLLLSGCGIRQTSYPVEAGAPATRAVCHAPRQSSPGATPAGGADGAAERPKDAGPTGDNGADRAKAREGKAREGKAEEGEAGASAGAPVAGSAIPPTPTVPRVSSLYMICGNRLTPIVRTLQTGPTAPVGTSGATGTTGPTGPTGSGSSADAAAALLDELSLPEQGGDKLSGFGTNVPPRLRVDPGGPSDPEGSWRLDRAPGELAPWALGQIVCTFAANFGSAGTGDPVLLGGPGGAPVRSYSCTGRMLRSPDGT